MSQQQDWFNLGWNVVRNRRRRSGSHNNKTGSTMLDSGSSRSCYDDGCHTHDEDGIMNDDSEYSSSSSSSYDTTTTTTSSKNDKEGSKYPNDTTADSEIRRPQQKQKRPRRRRTNRDPQEGSLLSSFSSTLRCIQRFWCRDKNNNPFEWITDYYASDGEMFRKNLSHQDRKDISYAKYLFHTSSILAILLYYSNVHQEIDEKYYCTFRTRRECYSNNMKKFPASISYTIRRGVPQRVHFMVWMTGWYYMLRAIRNAGSNKLRQFSKYMLSTGIFSITFCRLGQNSKLIDGLHFGSAGIYMIQHVVLLQVLNTHPYYKKLFYKSFLALLTSIVGLRHFEKRYNIHTESQCASTTTPRQRYIQLSRLPPFQQRCIFWLELLLMVSENMLFTSFIQGMTSGLSSLPLKEEQRGGRRQQQQEDDDEEDEDEEGRRIWQQQEKHLDTVSLSDDDDEQDDDQDVEEFLDACG